MTISIRKTVRNNHRQRRCNTSLLLVAFFVLQLQGWQLIKLMNGSAASTSSHAADSDLEWLVANSIKRNENGPIKEPLSKLPSATPDVASVAESGADTQQSFLASNSTITSTDVNTKPYAFMWIIGGIRLEEPAYRGFLYDVMISVYLFRNQLHAKDSDFWLLLQFKHNATHPASSENLPAAELALLRALDIHVQVLPPPKQATFAQIVYEKFKALTLTQYRRVAFLDADTIPLVNLEYLFHLSDPLSDKFPTILRPNLIMASRGEPCNTGFFIVEPSLKNYQLLQTILQRSQEYGKTLPYPHFDWKFGWGHHFGREGTHWESIQNKNGNHWRFHAGHSDQGLMYYLTRFGIKDVSIVIGEDVQNWYQAGHVGEQTSGPTLQETLTKGLDPYFPGPPLEHEYNCHQGSTAHFKCTPVFQGFAHFMGKRYVDTMCF